MKLDKIIQFFELYCSNKLSVENDCSGLQVINFPSDIKKIIIALDCSEKVINQAIIKKCNLIITHHPLFWPNKEKGIEDDFTKIKLEKLRKNKISVYSFHTNFDNKFLKLEMFNLLPLKEIPNKTTQLIAVGKTEKELTIKEWMKIIKEKFQNSYLLYQKNNYNQTIKKIAIVPGAGGEALDYCKKNKIDMLITGELKWSEWVKGLDYHINLITIGHDKEQLFINKMKKDLNDWLKTEKEENVKVINHFASEINLFND